MRVGLILGILTSGLLLIIGLSTQQFETYSVISGTLGIICFLLAGIVSDALTGEDRIRSNYFSENKKNHKKGIRCSYLFFLLGAPNLLVAVVLTLNYI
ncbi:DUF5316 family protein [Bacillus sinesaloumensis]|uniref:DUF5316 family protein n=1 Tax=Litchfieldia sinesaloumensis TaxID=1926280 RepID=UPI0009887297|nr:DUF5316 family protein [Bacillus sinesaloumensis]